MNQSLAQPSSNSRLNDQAFYAACTALLFVYKNGKWYYTEPHSQNNPQQLMASLLQNTLPYLTVISTESVLYSGQQ
jgi:hypothetical protein